MGRRIFFFFWGGGGGGEVNCEVTKCDQCMLYTNWNLGPSKCQGKRGLLDGWADVCVGGWGWGEETQSVTSICLDMEPGAQWMLEFG